MLAVCMLRLLAFLPRAVAPYSLSFFGDHVVLQKDWPSLDQKKNTK